VTASCLGGKTVLLLEDDFLIALELASHLRALGVNLAGPCCHISDAQRLSTTLRLDLALLDVNVGGERSVAFARRLAERGVACAFLTGYSSVPELPEVPIINKPVLPGALEVNLRELLCEC